MTLRSNRQQFGPNPNPPTFAGDSIQMPSVGMKQMAGDSNAVGNVLRLPGVYRMKGLGRSTIYRIEAARQFPQRIKLRLRAVGWMELEVREWLAMRAEAREVTSPTR